MKKIVNSLLAVALSLGLWSCAKEQPVDAGAAGDASLQFTMKSATAPFVTRADIATANEWNIATLDVYAVEKGGTPVKKLVSGTDYTMVENKSSHTFTITMKPAWMSTNQGKTMSFFFVGNDATSIYASEYEPGVWGHSGTVLGSSSNTMSEANLLTMLTDDHFNHLVPEAIFEHRPNGSDKNLMFTATAEIEINGTVKHTGHLKRRQARFDIEVEADMASNFVLKQVMVEGVTAAVPFFLNDAVALNNTSHHEYGLVLSSHLAYNAKNPATATSNNVVQGAFYMFPTVMGDYEIYGNKTEITIIGEFNGVETLYPVNVEAGTMVKPNYRYTLKLNPSTGEFEMIGDDWDEGETWEAEEGVNTEPASIGYVIPYDGVTDDTSGPWVGVNQLGNTFTVTDNAANRGFTFINVKSEFGTDYTIEYIAGGTAADNTLVVNKTKDFEFGTRATNAKVVETYRFLCPAGTEPIHAKVTLVSFEGEGGSYEFEIKRGIMESPYILHFMPDGTLAAGVFDNVNVTLSNMAFFKYGSVIGFDNNKVGNPNTGSTAWPTDGSAIHFNPTALVYGSQITAYAPATFDGATSNALPNIPGYVSADYPKNVTVADGYVTVANLKAGKGDPCMLVGYTGAQLAAMSDSELQGVLNNAAYRLPTNVDNQKFSGCDVQITAANGWAAHWFVGDGTNYASYPSIGKFPVVDTDVAADTYILPAAGNRAYNTGAVGALGIIGSYWSATTASDMYGHFLNFYSNYITSTHYNTYSSGFSIRCVPNV